MSFFNKKKDENKEVNKNNINKIENNDSEFSKILNEKKQEEDLAKEVEAKQQKKEERKKEKKDYTKYNPILDLKFWFKLVGGVVLLVIALALMFQKDLRERICVGIFGGVVAVFAIYRIYPTFKYTKGAGPKVACIVEIIVDFAVGVLLVVGGFNFSDSGKDLAEFTNKYFHYFLGLVFYLRGIVYTLCAIMFKEESTFKKYVINILCLTCGAYVFASDNFLVEALGWALVILSLISAAYLLVEGGIDYTNYRNHNEQRRIKTEQKKKEKEQKKREKEAEKGEAKKDKPIEKEEKIIIPDEKGNDQKQDIC